MAAVTSISTSSSETAFIVGITFGLLVVICASVAIYCYRRRRLDAELLSLILVNHRDVTRDPVGTVPFFTNRVSVSPGLIL